MPVVSDGSRQAVLRGCFLFGSLDGPSFEEVRDLVEERPCRIGDSLFREGDEGDAFYVVADGVVKLTKEVPGGGEALVVAQLGEGEIVGEMSLVSDAPRTTGCSFTSNGWVWRLSRAAFESLGRSSPAVHAAIMHNIAVLLCERLGTMTREVSAMLADMETVGDDVTSLEEQLERGRTGLMDFLGSLGRRGEARRGNQP
jgi:CRP-like cAMP-binding protein